MVAPDIGVRFGGNLLAARRRAGFSQEELALFSSLHRTAIGLLEGGRRIPRIDTLVKLASSLAMPPGELLTGIDWVPGRESPGSFLIDR